MPLVVLPLFWGGYFIWMHFMNIVRFIIIYPQYGYIFAKDEVRVWVYVGQFYGLILPVWGIPGL